MSAHKEKDFILPMLKIVAKHKDGCNTDTIIDEIETVITLSSEDLEESPSRKNECKYKQIIRNVISHKNAHFFNNVVTKIINGKTFFNINENGRKIIKEEIPDDICQNNPDVIDFDNNQNACLSLDNLYDIYDKRLFEMVSNPCFSKITKDKALSEAIKKIYNYECLYTKLTNGPKDYIYKDKFGNNYIEAHHLIPISAWKDFFPKSLDRPSNLVPLAQYYHGIIHHGANEKKKEILQILYNEMISGLNADGIYISFDELFEKYYKEN